jgi:hypothetical protein
MQGSDARTKQAQCAPTCRQARPPACAMTDAPLKTVVMMRLKSLMTGEPSAKRSCSGTTVQPRRTPVKPAYLLKEQVSIAHVSAPDQARTHLSCQRALPDNPLAAVRAWCTGRACAACFP